MAFSIKNKARNVALDYEAMQLPKINPHQGPVLTKLFQLQGAGSANPAADTIGMNVIPWVLTTPIVIERIGCVASHQNAGITVGQRVACTVNIISLVQPFNTLPPQFPTPATLPVGWTFAGLEWRLDFPATEALRDYAGDQVVFMPDTYQFEIFALGTFALGDSCDFCLTIHYKLQM